MVKDIPAGVKGMVIPAVFVLAGIGVAAGIATAPSETLNEALARSGIAGLVPAAGPPIGLTGRTLLALFAGALVAALGSAGLLKQWLLAREGAVEAEEKPPVVRRADAHPDAPPRRPIRASADLGAPLPIAKEAVRKGDVLPFALEPRAVEEMPLPADLDQPMSAFDPAAVPQAPAAPPEPVAPLYRAPERAVVERDWVEVVVPDAPVALAMTPPEVSEPSEAAAATLPTDLPGAPLEVATVPEVTAVEEQRQDDSIAALLARLERGAQRRQAAVTPDPAPEPEAPASLDDTLQTLRRMAAR